MTLNTIQCNAMLDIITPINIFVISLFVIAWTGSWLVDLLARIARYLGWREFVVAFLLMAFAGSIPNLAVGINSALQGIPELAFGDIVGNNVIDLTLAVALTVLILGSAIPAGGATLRSSALFAPLIALFPLLLILDGSLSRIDGVMLIGVFIFYLTWLFSRGERFRREFDDKEEEESQGPVGEFRDFLTDLGKIAAGGFLLIAGADGVVWSATSFAEYLELPLPVVGILLVGLGTSFPEMYFAIAAAKKGRLDMILGDLMGNVIALSTLVLGITVLIHPIAGVDLSPFAIARVFLVVSAAVFFVAARTGRKIDKGEAFVLLGLYIFFVLLELLAH